MAIVTLDDLLNALFRPDDDFYRKNFRSFWNNPRTDLQEKVDFTISHFVTDSAGHEHEPYYKRFMGKFNKAELERIFRQDICDMLILVKQLYDDTRLRKLKHPYQYLPYFVELLPEILKKAQSKEDILRWDTAVKDMIVEYAELNHPYYYITRPLKQLVQHSQSFEILEKAKELVSRAKGEVLNHLYVFTGILSEVQGKVKEPRGLEEWYQPIIDVIKRYDERIGERSHLGPLIEFVKSHNNPASLQSFRPY